MKVHQWELDIQGGYPCDVCGSSSPCGNIRDCAFWTSGSKYSHPQQTEQVDTRVQEYDCKINGHDYIEDELYFRCGWCGEYKPNEVNNGN